MIEISDLKNINMLQPLDEKRLERMRDIASLESQRKGHFFYHVVDTADKVYAVLSGRVGLAIAKRPYQHTWVVEVGPSNTFGVSAAIFTPGRTHMTCAKALTDVKVLSWRSDDLQHLFEEDFELGYRYMSELARIIKDRLQVKNIQSTDIYS
ncbi:MAG: cyclic nucleotide-binding domain-containing protein [Desulfobacterales bacterium]